MTDQPTPPENFTPPPAPTKPWWKRKRVLIPAGVLLFIVIAGIFGDDPEDTPSVASAPTTEAPTTTTTSEVKPPPPPPTSTPSATTTTTTAAPTTTAPATTTTKDTTTTTAPADLTAESALSTVRANLDLWGNPIAAYIPKDGSTGRSVGTFLVVVAQLDRNHPDAERLCGAIASELYGIEGAPWTQVEIESGTQGGKAARCDVLAR